MRRVRERVLEHVREHGRERAYVDGIEEISDRDDIFYVDPDKLTSNDPEQLLKQLIKQVEGQLPEEFAENEIDIDIKDVMTDGEAAEAFILFANDIKDSGPAAVTSAGIVSLETTKEHILQKTMITTPLWKN